MNFQRLVLILFINISIVGTLTACGPEQNSAGSSVNCITNCTGKDLGTYPVLPPPAPSPTPSGSPPPPMASPTPTPTPSPSQTATLNFTQPDPRTVHQSSGQLIQYKIPTQKTKLYKQIKVEFDFYNNGWCTYAAHDQHGLMQFNRGSKWRSDLISWVPIMGAGKSVIIRSNINDPNAGAGDVKTTKRYTPLQIGQSKWHHAKYVYDALARQIRLSIEEEGGDTFTMVAPTDHYAGNTLEAKYDYLTLTFGSWDSGASGPECDTEGWIFSKLVVQGFE